MAFITVFTNVLLMMCYLAVGFTLVKTKKGDTSHARTLSALLIYVLGPCLIISSFQKMDYSMDNFKKTAAFFAVSLIIQLLFFGVLFLIFNKKFNIPKYRILSAGALLGNCGFFGHPVITGLFPNNPEVGCYSAAFMVSMNLLVFTVGVFLITNKKEYISLKSALLNPTMFAALIAVPLYLLNYHFPLVVGDTVVLLGKMSTPICMIVLGMRLASMDFKETFATPFAYIASGIKLIVFPLFALLCVKFIPFFDDVFKVSMFVLCATPSAAVILSLAELHRCEQKLAANVILLSTLLSLITMPLMLLII